VFGIDESKLRILQLLRKPMTVTELARETGLSKATVSYHLRALQKLRLVKVERVEVCRNFMKKYFVSVLSSPDLIAPQEVKILSDFTLSREEFLRTLLRLLNVLNLDNVIVRKAGFDLGYHSLAEKIDGNIQDGLAEIWEKLNLGRVVESSKDRFVVEDCYNCSGLPAIGKPYCRIDEGIIEGVLCSKTGERKRVREIRCWGTGDECCEFEIK